MVHISLPRLGSADSKSQSIMIYSVTYHFFGPQSHLLVREAMVIVRTALSRDEAMALVAFAAGGLFKLLVTIIL